ncbi:MAG: flagellar cap protein FliD N-terminal domain-containing protein, partial [Dehalococcoidia bacterium]|nr:flagellar cap protein FliD N-terminal domain-containing protein [Dehalococcoidia bacterium]
MSLQATGLISGFDVNSIIDDLIKAESAPRQRLEERERILVAQQDELKTINSNLLLLQSRAASLADRTSTLQKIATSSDISILSATASTSAPRQTHQIEVTQLATASRNTSTINISKPLELNRLAKLTLEGTSNTGSFYLDNYSSTNTVSLTTSTDLDDIISTNGATFVPSEDTYQNLSYKSTYRGEGADARLSVTKRISKRDTDADGNAVLTDKTKSLVANPITFTDTDTNTTSTLGLSTNPQTIFGTGDAYDANSKQLNLDASNQTHLLGAIRIVESQNSGTSQVDEAGNVSASATSFDVDDGSKFTVGNTIVVDNEQMTVTGISSDTLTVTRGVNGTTATTHNNDVYVYGDIVRVSTGSIGNIAKSDVLTFTGGGLGTSAVTGTVQGIVNIETGTFAISGDAASYDLTEGNITANSGAGSSANAFTATALTPGAFTVDNSTYYVPKVLDSSLAVRQSNTNNIATTQKLSEVSSSITAGTVTINGTSVYVSPSTLLNGALNNSSTTVNVDDGSVYSSGDTIIVDSEEMTITGISGNALTVSRGANSTTAAAHDDNSPTSLRVEDATVANLLSQLSTVSGITAALTDGGRIQIKANAGVPLSVQDGTSNLASQLNFSQGITSGKSLSEFGVNAGTFTISDTATTTSATVEITSSTSIATTLSSAI